MSHKLFTFLLFIFSLISVQAQTKTDKAEVSFSKKYEVSKKNTIESIIGYDDAGFYALQTRSKESSTIVLEHYDNDMHRIKSSEIDLGDKKIKRKFEFIVQMKNKLYLFSSLRSDKAKSNSLHVQEINKSSLTAGEIGKVAEITDGKTTLYGPESFNYTLSRDSSKLLIYYNLPYNIELKEQFSFHVFNDDMVEMWKKEVILPYKEKLFLIENYTLSNQGEVYLLGINYKEKFLSKRKGKPNYNYHVLAYSENGNRFDEYPIEIKDNFLTDMKIAVNSEKDIICGGFYSEKGTFSIKGSYFLKIDGESKAIKSKSFKEFGINFITQNMTEREEKRAKRKKAKGKNVELYEYDLDNIILKKDGGAILVGEQYYVKVYSTQSSSISGRTFLRSTYHYYYNDIIVISLSPEGAINWTEKIPKRQISLNDEGYYSSYTLARVDDKLYFIFNDNVKNLFYMGKGKIEPFRRNNDAIVTLVQVDGDGRQVKEGLFSETGFDIYIRPKQGKQISANELILFGQDKKTQRFTKITFNN